VVEPSYIKSYPQTRGNFFYFPGNEKSSYPQAVDKIVHRIHRPTTYRILEKTSWLKRQNRWHHKPSAI